MLKNGNMSNPLPQQQVRRGAFAGRTPATARSLTGSSIYEFLLFVQITIGGFIGAAPFVPRATEAVASSEKNLMYPIRTAVTILIIAFVLLFRSRFLMNKRVAFAGLYCLFLIFSATWSVDAAATFRAALDFSLFATSILLLIAPLPLHRTTNVLLAVLAVTCVTSAGLAIALPQIGVASGMDVWTADQAGAWRGVFDDKNGLGGTSMVAILAMVSFWRYWTLPVPIKALSLACAILCTFFARSANPILGAAFALILAALMMRRPSRFRVIATLLALSAAIAFVALTPIAGIISEAIGRDSTFNSRSGIWMTTVETWRRHWLLGYGYVAGTREVMLPILAGLYGVSARHAHSNYLEALVETGIVGFSLLAMVLMFSLFNLCYRPWDVGDRDRRATQALMLIVASSVQMAAGDVMALRLVGGWGAITWAAVLASCTYIQSRTTRVVRGGKPAPVPAATAR